jgi:hypothetical protein
MMSWNYRIVRYRNGALALHEVHYDEKGEPKYRTNEPTDFVCDADEGPAGIVASLEMALNDARDRPVLDDWVKEAKP